jgi:hypothetical protein
VADGFPESFAPHLGVGWISRGENIDAKRRSELRRVMQSRYAAIRKESELEVDREWVRYLELLTREHLTSSRALQLLEQMKPLEELLPAIDLKPLHIGPLENLFSPYERRYYLTLGDTDD